MSALMKRGFGVCLNVAVVLLAIVSTCSYTAYTSVGGSMKSGIYFAVIAAVVTGCAAVFTSGRLQDWLLLAEVVLLSTGFALFVASDDVILTFVDYLFKIDYWGNTALLPNIMMTAVLFLISTLLAVAVCFLAKTNTKNGGKNHE